MFKPSKIQKTKRQKDKKTKRQKDKKTKTQKDKNTKRQKHKKGLTCKNENHSHKTQKSCDIRCEWA